MKEIDDVIISVHPARNPSDLYRPIVNTSRDENIYKNITAYNVTAKN